MLYEVITIIRLKQLLDLFKSTIKLVIVSVVLYTEIKANLNGRNNFV